MRQQFLARVGVMGYVGRFAAALPLPVSRGSRVICRTERGLEVAELLGDVEKVSSGEVDGTVLRIVTPSDDLLLARIEKHRDDAYRACALLLKEQQLDVTLMEVEQLFDGATLVFYFLGETTAELESITGRLAEEYESKVQFRRFAESVMEGCGPDCGTDEGAGCSLNGCSSCLLATSCSASMEK
ncbi:MAG: PSP1 C-terminal domain-containing protein [Pirellulaceae bacterium]